METNHWDAFICHASEDKNDFVRPLATMLTSMGLKIWYDELSIQVGDRISQKIDEGLRLSDFGVVVLSESFFQKSWPSSELSALESKAMNTGKTTILPIWYKISKDDIAKFSAILADTAAIPADSGLGEVASRLVSRIKKNLVTSNTSQIIHSGTGSYNISDRSIIKDDELDPILQAISNPDTAELRQNSMVKKFEKYSRDKIILCNDKTWQIIHILIRTNNRDFVIYALMTIRNIINNDNDKRDLIRNRMINEFEMLREIEINHIDLTDRIKDDIFFIIRKLYNDDEFSDHACEQILYAINNIVDDQLYHIYKMPYFDFFLKNKDYISKIKPQLDLLMLNVDKAGRRAQDIYDELD